MHFSHYLSAALVAIPLVVGTPVVVSDETPERITRDVVPGAPEPPLPSLSRRAGGVTTAKDTSYGRVVGRAEGEGDEDMDAAAEMSSESGRTAASTSEGSVSDAGSVPKAFDQSKATEPGSVRSTDKGVVLFGPAQGSSHDAAKMAVIAVVGDEGTKIMAVFEPIVDKKSLTAARELLTDFYNDVRDMIDTPRVPVTIVAPAKLGSDMVAKTALITFLNEAKAKATLRTGSGTGVLLTDEKLFTNLAVAKDGKPVNPEAKTGSRLSRGWTRPAVKKPFYKHVMSVRPHQP